MNPLIDDYLKKGCMRCPYGDTPQCKVHYWQPQLKALRTLMLETELTEELKWGVPCYTYAGKNVASISAYKDFACISFFKGALVPDPHQLLQKPGESSQSARLIKFTTVNAIEKHKSAILTLLKEAIEIEKSGKKVAFEKQLEPMPEELKVFLDQNQNVKEAFNQLTPGRQRGYIIYVSQPKSSQSKIDRINKCVEKILKGEGLNDKYGKKMR